jgi:hypothetical protein
MNNGSFEKPIPELLLPPPPWAEKGKKRKVLLTNSFTSALLAVSNPMEWNVLLHKGESS